MVVEDLYSDDVTWHLACCEVAVEYSYRYGIREQETWVIRQIANMDVVPILPSSGGRKMMNQNSKQHRARTCDLRTDIAQLFTGKPVRGEILPSKGPTMIADPGTGTIKLSWTCLSLLSIFILVPGAMRWISGGGDGVVKLNTCR